MTRSDIKFWLCVGVGACVLGWLLEVPPIYLLLCGAVYVGLVMVLDRILPPSGGGYE